MNYRTKEYMRVRKAQRRMQHPGDLASFLKAELELCDSGVVKRHVKKALEQLQTQAQPALQTT